MPEQTIWLAPRATAFTDLCASCENEHPATAGSPAATVSGTLRLEAEAGWATCPRGHVLRVLRMNRRMPAGALR
jgi:hypothetical protein